MKNSITKRESSFLAITIALMVLLPALNYYLNNIARRLLGVVLPISPILYGLMFVLELFCINIILNRRIINKLSVNIAVIGFFLTFFSYLVYSDSIGNTLVAPGWNIIESQAIVFVVFCLPAFVICSSFADWKYLLRPFSLLSPFIVIIGFYAFYLQDFSTHGEGKMNYMSLSYFILTSSCFCFLYFWEKMRILYGVVSLVGLFVIIAAGCRGALLCYSVFALLILFWQFSTVNKRSKRSYFQKTLSVIVLILLFSTASLSFITDWFSDLGISSRTVEMLNEGTFLEDQSRNNIRNVLWQGIIENPIGYGLFGDRYITTKYYSNGTEYAHNIIYELLIDFGFLGFLLIAIYVISTVSFFYRKYKNDCIWVLFLLFIPEGFIELFFSGSYLLDVKTWILMGMLINRKNILFLNRV